MMAGDWIKMRHCVLTSPEVVRISSALQADRLRTVGALYVLWCIADMHATDDGTLPDYTTKAVDEAVNWTGFADAVVNAGWLCEVDKGLRIPNFQRHNGKNARRRALDATRKDSVRKMSASKADKKRTREEKRREEKTPKPLPGFDRFWAAWPSGTRKKSRPQCLQKWTARNLESMADEIVASVEAHKKSKGWLKDDGQYIPGPLPWLNQNGWEATPQAGSTDGCPDPANREDWWKDEDGTWIRKDTAEYGRRVIAFERRRRERNGSL